MTVCIGKTHRKMGWATVFAVAVTLVVHNVMLEHRLRSLRQQLLYTDEAIERVRHELEIGERMCADANYLFQVWRSHDRELAEMLRECISREDFVVREGRSVVWSELKTSHNGSKSSKLIGMYLPTGRHWLKCTVLSGELVRTHEPGSFDGDKTFSSDSSRFDQQRRPDAKMHVLSTTSSELTGPEIYEIKITTETNGGVTISIIGSANATLHEDTARPLEGIAEFGPLQVISFFGFVSGMTANDNSLPSFERSLPEVTDLALLDVIGLNRNAQALIRLIGQRHFFEGNVRDMILCDRDRSP